MESYQEKAYNCLTEVEQNSLFLNLSQGLSTWQISEILKLSHYKYLEVKARAEKFFKMFSDYFEKHESLVSPNAPLDTRFIDYLYGSMIHRLPKEEAVLHPGDSSWVLSPIRISAITKNIMRLKESDGEWDKDLYALIMEFDRWNNYRILPRILQAPSAFKRRTTRKDKVYLAYLHRIPEFKIRALVDMYWRAGKPSHRYFASFVSDIFPDGYAVVPIKKEKAIIKELTDTKIYIFENQLDADEFGLMAKQYFIRTTNSKAGLQFWKTYREIIARAINFREIKNMDFTCSNLDMAYGLKRKKIHEIVKQRKNNSKNS